MARNHQLASSDVRGREGSSDNPIYVGREEEQYQAPSTKDKPSRTHSPKLDSSYDMISANDEYIPLDFSDSPATSPAPSPSPPPLGGRDRKHADPHPGSSRFNDGEREGSSVLKRARGEREWDRGKEFMKYHNYREPGRKGKERDLEEVQAGDKRKHDFIFDMADAYDSHRRGVAKRAPWLDGLDFDHCHNVAEVLHCEVEAFVKYMSPTPVEDEIRGLIVAQISDVVQTKYPDAEVFPFGSYQTKLYLPQGDIDLVVRSESMAYSDTIVVLRGLANTLQKAKITEKVQVISKAKVPIIKFTTSLGYFNVDISLNQGNGVRSGHLINRFLSHGPGGLALRALVLVVKCFLSQRGMNEVYSGGLGSYSIVCLVMSFLQMHPKIRRGEIDPEKNLGVLVMDFFELYGLNFNYENAGISVRDGGTYYSKRQRGWYDFSKKDLLSIEDPTDAGNDISKGSFGFQRVRATFAGAYSMMTAAAYLRAGIISSRRSGHSYDLREHHSPEDLSILSCVLQIDNMTFNHRLLIQEIYDNRTLHRMLNVAPRAQLVNADEPRTNSKHLSDSKDELSTASHTHAVRQAYEDISDMALSDDSSRSPKGQARQNGVRLAHLENVDDEDQNGRYAIGREPPNKRRRVGRAVDAHTVFTTDDDDDEELEQLAQDREDQLISTYVADAEPDPELDRVRAASIAAVGSGSSGGVMSSNGTKETRQRRKRNRDYWLSKGIGPGEEEDEDESW